MTITQSKTSYDYVGCDYYAGNVGHLVISMAERVTADAYGQSYLDGNQVIIMARDSSTNDVYGYLAVASGEQLGNASLYWPEFNHPNSPANQVLPVTRIHKLPVSLTGPINQRGIANQYRADVATYLLRRG